MSRVFDFLEPRGPMELVTVNKRFSTWSYPKSNNIPQKKQSGASIFLAPKDFMFFSSGSTDSGTSLSQQCSHQVAYNASLGETWRLIHWVWLGLIGFYGFSFDDQPHKAFDVHQTGKQYTWDLSEWTSHCLGFHYSVTAMSLQSSSSAPDQWGCQLVHSPGSILSSHKLVTGPLESGVRKSTPNMGCLLRIEDSVTTTFLTGSYDQ